MSRRAAAATSDAPRRLPRATERELRRIQRRIERYYALESAPDVVLFASAGSSGEREVLLVRDGGPSVEMALRVPGDRPRAGANDVWLQLVEGVSHFVYLAERVRTGLPTTQLELELQAEIDKFVFLAFDPDGAEPEQALSLHEKLYSNVEFLHPRASEVGERYWLANQLAAQLSARLLRRAAVDVKALLRRFYRAGQAEKIALARAA